MAQLSGGPYGSVAMRAARVGAAAKWWPRCWLWMAAMDAAARYAVVVTARAQLNSLGAEHLNDKSYRSRRSIGAPTLCLWAPMLNSNSVAHC